MRGKMRGKMKDKKRKMKRKRKDERFYIQSAPVLVFMLHKVFKQPDFFGTPGRVNISGICLITSSTGLL
jgi:hypothetical protein